MVGFVENEVYVQMAEITWGKVSSSLPLISLRSSAVFGIPSGYS